MTTNYIMEELILIVAKLAGQYTGGDSSSISNSKAQQLMGAVLYCIQANEPEQQQALVSNTKIPAQQAYELGYCLIEKRCNKRLPYTMNCWQILPITVAIFCTIQYLTDCQNSSNGMTYVLNRRTVS